MNVFDVTARIEVMHDATACRDLPTVTVVLATVGPVLVVSCSCGAARINRVVSSGATETYVSWLKGRTQ